jgi:hypothetical protein
MAERSAPGPGTSRHDTIDRGRSISFVVQGEIDGRPVAARWVDGELHCDADVRDRADLVVAMGERFGHGAHEITASVDDDFGAALLTVVRSLSRIRSVEISMPRTTAG